MKDRNMIEHRIERQSREIRFLFGIALVLIAGAIGLVIYTNMPSQNKISNVTITETGSFNHIEWEHNGKHTKVNVEVISRIKQSEKSFSYYRYFDEQYTLYLTPDNYAKINEK